MLPFYVYILRCFDGFYYVGHTDDIEKRISMHNQGKVSNFTQKRLPVEVVFVQEFPTRTEAIDMERRIKGWSRKKKEALIEENWDELIRLSNLKKQVIDPSTSSGRTEKDPLKQSEDRFKKGTLIHNISSIIQHTISLADKNWFQTGGMARYFIEPRTALEMVDAVMWAQQQQMPIFVLGSGANILISDDGFDGLVIRPQLVDISHSFNGQYGYITAGAGISLDELISYCLQHGFTGLEEFSGIPGTVGGAVYINLHYFEFLLSQFLVEAEVIDIHTGQIIRVDNAWFAFGYNVSRLHDKRYILVSATFCVRRTDEYGIAYAKGRRTEIIRHRNKRYPQERTCGSFFRNFYEHEVMLESEGKKVIWVAYYLDKIGVKGMLTIGGAQVSHQHANMIINRGAAKSADIIGVAWAMQERVYAAFGILPQPECQLIGFKEYPLLKK